MKYVLFFFLIFYSFVGFSQQDSITLKEGFVLKGQVKGLSSNVLSFETSYSDDDFKIDFDEVTKIDIYKNCFFILSQGRRRTGKIKSLEPKRVVINSKEKGEESFHLSEIIQIEVLEDLFWERLSAYFDLGYNLTKANSTSQFTFSGGLYYKGPKWVFNSDINSLRSRQDNNLNVQRTNAYSELKRVFIRKWYLLASFGYLSNTQQALNSRYNSRLGLGRYLVSNNKLLLGLSLGLNYNLEDFSNASSSSESTEMFLSANLNLFNFENFDLNSRVDFFPSLSESGRRRLDYMIDARYKLPLDFYVKAGLQFNYDNQSASTGSDFDYIFTSGFGWKFN